MMARRAGLSSQGKASAAVLASLRESRERKPEAFQGFLIRLTGYGHGPGVFGERRKPVPDLPRQPFHLVNGQLRQDTETGLSFILEAVTVAEVVVGTPRGEMAVAYVALSVGNAFAPGERVHVIVKPVDEHTNAGDGYRGEGGTRP
jgi:hypothetical protein